MKDPSRPVNPRRKDQSPRVYRVYRPPVRRASTTVVAARVVLAAVLLALVLALAAQL